MSTEKTFGPLERLSFDRTVELLREVIAEFGEDYVYEAGNGGCFYVRDGGPSCLVAQVLARAGVPIEALAELDRAYRDASVHTNRELFERWAEPAAVDLLDDAQYEQDSGAIWGKALAYALEQQIGDQE